jgi:hypothetical protein
MAPTWPLGDKLVMLFSGYLQVLGSTGSTSLRLPGHSFAPTIRQEVLLTQPEFNQSRPVKLATALTLAQLR